VKKQEIENLTDIVLLGADLWKNYKAFDTSIPMSPEERQTYQTVRIALTGSAIVNFEEKAIDSYCRSLLFTLEFLEHPAASFLKEKYNSLLEQSEQ